MKALHSGVLAVDMTVIASPHPLPCGAKSAILSLSRLAAGVKEGELRQPCRWLVSAPRARRLAHHAGQICAEMAISMLGADDAFGRKAVIERGSAGEPIWPAGIVGSITHTRDFACAVAAPTAAYAGIGIDSEKFIDETSCDGIAAACLTPGERKRFLQGSISTRCMAATAIFCMKEAFYKAAYPRVRRYIEFDEIEITGLDPSSGYASIRTSALGRESECIRGGFVVSGDHVHACVALHESDRSKHGAAHVPFTRP